MYRVGSWCNPFPPALETRRLGTALQGQMSDVKVGLIKMSGYSQSEWSRWLRQHPRGWAKGNAPWVRGVARPGPSSGPVEGFGAAIPTSIQPVGRLVCSGRIRLHLCSGAASPSSGSLKGRRRGASPASSLHSLLFSSLHISTSHTRFRITLAPLKTLTMLLTKTLIQIAGMLSLLGGVSAACKGANGADAVSLFSYKTWRIACYITLAL